MARILEANQNILAEFANNFMGGVYIAPNIKKESVRIDPAGNIIDIKTKQVIKSVEPEFIPPIPEPIDTIKNPPKTSKIDELISKKIEEIINIKITEALNNL